MEGFTISAAEARANEDALERELPRREIEQPRKLESCTVPEEFTCPLSMTVMVEPVIIASGHTFEKKQIVEFLKHNEICPKSFQVLPHTLFIPNIALAGLIDKWCEANRYERPKLADEDMDVDFAAQAPQNEDEELNRQADLGVEVAVQADLGLQVAAQDEDDEDLPQEAVQAPQADDENLDEDEEFDIEMPEDAQAQADMPEPEPQAENPNPEANPRFAQLQAAFDLYHRNVAIMADLVEPEDDGMPMHLLAPLRARRLEEHPDLVQ